MLAMRLSWDEDDMAAPRPHAADCTTTVRTATPAKLLPAPPALPPPAAPPPPLLLLLSPSTEKLT